MCVQQAFTPVTGQLSHQYTEMTSSYDGNSAVAEDQEDFECSRQLDELSESAREWRRDRDRERDSDRGREHSSRHRSGDR